MKKKLIIIFITVFIFNIFLSYLEYRGSSSPELHSEILKYFSQADISKGEIYERSGFSLSIVKSVIFAFLLLIMSFSSLSIKLENFCSVLAKGKPFLASIYFIAIIYLSVTLIFLPFNFYFSYILEHRAGFSNMTAGFWFLTRLKSFALILPFISFLGSSALFIIKKFRFYSVFVVPFGGLVIALVMTIIYPLMILPIFYEITGIDNPALEKRINEIAARSGVTVDKIYVIKESDYSKHTNAFFVGFGSNKKIYLYDTLLKNNSDSEIAVILAHEIGHWIYNHNMKGIVFGFLLYAALFSGIYVSVRKILIESGPNAGEIYSPSMIPLYFLLFILFSSFTDPLEMYVSRRMEMNADSYALELTGDPDAFISSEIKIARDNSLRLNNHPFTAFFRYSHPVTIDRIMMAERYKESQNIMK